MIENIDTMVTDFERGTIDRRQLVVRIGATVAAFAAAGHVAVGEVDEKPITAAPSFKATGLNHIALGVEDVARARDFYEKHLGLTVLRDSSPNNCFMRCGDNFLALFRKGEPGMDHYCWTIDDYSAIKTEKELRELGLKPWREEARVYFKDADGITNQFSAPNDFKYW